MVTAISFPLIYINLEIPKRIVNNAIGGKNIPATFLGFEVTQISYLMGLSFLLLFLITVNGGIKYWLNVYSGVVGERTMRRLRHDLYQQVLRFPLPQFKTMSAGEIIPMIVAETEPVGGFIGESISLPVFQGGLLVTYLGVHLHAGLVAGPRRGRALSAAGLPDPAAAAQDQPARQGAGADGARSCRTASASRWPAPPRSAATTRSTSSARTSASASARSTRSASTSTSASSSSSS